MFNIYFVHKQSTFRSDHVREGSPLYKIDINEKTVAFITQTSNDKGAYFMEARENEISTVIKANHSERLSQYVRELMEHLTDEPGFVLPYSDGMSFIVRSDMHHGEKYEGGGYRIMLTVPMDDHTLYITPLQRKGCIVVDGNIPLLCDFVIKREANGRLFDRNQPEYWVDYSNASNLDKAMFMQSEYELYRFHASEIRDIERGPQPLKYYGMTRHEIKGIELCGSGLAIMQYTLSEIDAILAQRKDSGEKPVRYQGPDGGAIYDDRRNKPSSQGGFSDMRYPRVKPIYIALFTITVTTTKDTVKEFTRSADYDREDFHTFKSDYLSAVRISGYEHKDTLSALAILTGSTQAELRTNLPLKGIESIKIELKQVIQKDEDAEPVIIVLETI